MILPGREISGGAGGGLSEECVCVIVAPLLSLSDPPVGFFNQAYTESVLELLELLNLD